MKEKTYGAYATIYAKSEIEIKDFSDYFAKKTNIANYWTEHSKDKPYELVTYGEIMGFILCIESKCLNNHNDFNYEINLYTSEMAMETAYGRKHDISNWFAKYVCVVCNLIVVIKENDKYLCFSTEDKTGKIKEHYL